MKRVASSQTKPQTKRISLHFLKFHSIIYLIPYTIRTKSKKSKYARARALANLFNNSVILVRSACFRTLFTLLLLVLHHFGISIFQVLIIFLSGGGKLINFLIHLFINGKFSEHYVKILKKSTIISKHTIYLVCALREGLMTE